MPTIPDIQSFRSASPQPSLGAASYQPREPSPEGFVSGGREIQDAAQTIAAANERQAALFGQAGANSLNSQRVALQYDPNTGFANIKEGAALGQQFIDNFMGKFDAAQQSIRDSMQTPLAQRIFDEHAAIARTQFMGSLLEHQAQQTAKFNDSTDDATVSQSLNEMAQRPMDELGFQKNLTVINATIDSMAKRKGWVNSDGTPNKIADVMRARYLDAAYSTRIISIMNGIPGVVQANPYLAEKMFKQVQSQLGEASQKTLAEQVQNSVKMVQQRDMAVRSLNGVVTMKPSDIAPGVTGSPLEAVVQSQESGGQRYDSNGNLLTSPKGALGEMQVMPDTARNPGFGVRPAQDNSPEELARVGRDFLGAMTARYNNPALVLAAYNAGPGKVDEWLAKYGDPRMGQISSADWVSKIPYQETQSYVARGLQKLGTVGEETYLTANQVKTQLPAIAAKNRDAWEQMYPGDVVGAEGAYARTISYGNQIVEQQLAQQRAAHDTVISAVVGQKGDGSDAPKTIDDLLANPATKAAWDQSTPEMKLQVQRHFAYSEKKLDQQSASIYYQLLGQAGSDPEGFAKNDLSQYFGLMPDHLLLGLMGQQKSISQKDAAEAAKGENFLRARSVVDDMLKPLGMGKSAKPKSSNSQLTEQFYGRMDEAMQTFHDQNGKWPQQQDVRKIAASLLTEGQQAGGGWFGNDVGRRAFQVEDASKFYVPLPGTRTPEYAQLTSAFQRVMGHTPTQNELQQWYTLYKMGGGK